MGHTYGEMHTESPHEKYTGKLKQAMLGHGFAESRLDNHYNCYSCGCVVFGIELHWPLCIGRSNAEKELHQQLTALAKTLILEQLAVSRANLKDKVWEIVYRRLVTFDQDKIEAIERLTLVKVSEEAKIDTYHLDRALKLLADEKRIVVVGFYSSKVYMQDTVIARARPEENKNDRYSCPKCHASDTSYCSEHCPCKSDHMWIAGNRCDTCGTYFAGDMMG